MSDDINQQIERLQRRREAPVQGIIAATALGREASLLREELEGPARHLAPGDADNAISALTLTLWDMNVSSTQRAAAAWALGQIGGLQPIRKLLNRLESIFARRTAQVLAWADQDTQEEENEVRATLVEALARAVDTPTVRALNSFDHHQLRQVCNALLDQLRTPEIIDPDLATALATCLAKLALRAQSDTPRHTLRDLLHASEPIATLAAVRVLNELIPVEQQGKSPDETLDAAFHELEARRDQPYTSEERRRLLQLADQLRYAEQDTRLAGDHLWEKTQQALSGDDLAPA
jgi:hypothetical protein